MEELEQESERFETWDVMLDFAIKSAVPESEPPPPERTLLTEMLLRCWRDLVGDDEKLAWNAATWVMDTADDVNTEFGLGWILMQVTYSRSLADKIIPLSKEILSTRSNPYFANGKPDAHRPKGIIERISFDFETLDDYYNHLHSTNNSYNKKSG
jgi:hypothetical protein